MKKFCVLIMACMMLTSCGDTPKEASGTQAERTEEMSEAQAEQTEEASEAQAERTEEASEAQDTTVDDEFQEDDEALALWIEEMGVVDDAISELMQSEGFDDLETAEKAEKMLALINGLAADGTEEYNYPLIKAETIYYGGGDMISFEYAGGGLGGVKLEPFDPMMN